MGRLWFGRKGKKRIERQGSAAEKAFSQVFAGVDCDPNYLGFFMFLAFEWNGAKGIFQKNFLKNVL